MEKNINVYVAKNSMDGKRACEELGSNLSGFNGFVIEVKNFKLKDVHLKTAWGVEIKKKGRIFNSLMAKVLLLEYESKKFSDEYHIMEKGRVPPEMNRIIRDWGTKNSLKPYTFFHGQ